MSDFDPDQPRTDDPGPAIDVETWFPAPAPAPPAPKVPDEDPGVDTGQI
ncbi:hypothetical protein [Nocardiopsis ansamitocini]|uniref:Uncharacterized protein n=1 Tax=Nocardiopsis ansamitocini TaxID=1670832 RepID=A0A9W6PAD1_9ACTN|nr:hypothetical protein [Nocardiopsis ansamitocini]GLU49896.1 hypothetical protein Nans01_42470 [Nocardiopsis ansamitocini]